MTSSQIDAKYLTLGELFTTVGRMLETHGLSVRTNVTEVRFTNPGRFPACAEVKTDNLQADMESSFLDQG